MKYLVIEFGGNRTLESERRDSGGIIPLAKLLPWMRELCDVLTYLHGQSPPVVHRDLKPENILLNERGRIMLIDFGIAKQVQGFGETRVLARSASHGFSPPEQVLSTGTDARSDVYALGATMYALLTGKVPTAAHERLGGAQLPMPDTVNPLIPRALAVAIMQALELNSDRRQQSVAEVKVVLDRAFDPPPHPLPTGFPRPTVPVGPDPPQPTPPLPIPEPQPKPRRFAVPILAALGLAALAFVVLWPKPDGGPSPDITPTQPPLQPTTAPDPYNARTAMAEELARQQTASASVVEQPTQPPVVVVQPIPPTQAPIVAQPTRPAERPPTRRPRPTKPPAVVAAPTPKWQILPGESHRID
jgi:serine/threonine-protein kinase